MSIFVLDDVADALVSAVYVFASYPVALLFLSSLFSAGITATFSYRVISYSDRGVPKRVPRANWKTCVARRCRLGGLGGGRHGTRHTHTHLTRILFSRSISSNIVVFRTWVLEHCSSSLSLSAGATFAFYYLNLPPFLMVCYEPRGSRWSSLGMFHTTFTDIMMKRHLHFTLYYLPAHLLLFISPLYSGRDTGVLLPPLR